MIIILLSAAAQVSAWEQDSFIVTFRCAPPVTDETMSALAAEGYNLTWAREGELDIVARHGLRALLWDEALYPRSLDDPEWNLRLNALIERVKTHPGLEGYFLVDEPNPEHLPLWERMVAYLKERDPDHLAYINQWPIYANPDMLGLSDEDVKRARKELPSNFRGIGRYEKSIAAYREYLRRYVQRVKPELISYDHYNLLTEGDGWKYFLNMALIREAAQSADIPFVNIVQASSIEDSHRLPDKDEIRWLVYTTLAYGGRGISYFIYWGPSPYGLYQDGECTPLALDAAAINRELRVIGPEMMRLESREVYHTKPVPAGCIPIPDDSPVKILGGGEFVLGLFENEGKVDTFMIVNRSYERSAMARVMLPENVRELKEFNRITGRWRTYVRVSPGVPVTIGMGAGDGLLMRMSGE